MNPVTVLGIDPGMTTGWCMMEMHNQYDPYGGVLILNEDEDEEPVYVLFDEIVQMLSDYDVDLVCYEEPVARGMASRSLNRQIAAIIIACEHVGIPHYPVNPGTLKKFATGRGNANKEEMREAMGDDFYEGAFDDHNEVDAYWLAKFGCMVVLPTMEICT